MDDDERRLLRESLTKAVLSASDLRAAVTGFGWQELLAEDQEFAVATLAELQGELLPAGTMLDDVVLAAAGIEGPAAVGYPRLPHMDPDEANDDPIRAVVCNTTAHRLVVPLRHGGDIRIHVVEQPPHLAPLPGLDLCAQWRQVELVDARPADTVGDSVAWLAMRAAAHRFLAHELTAVGSRMLALAVAHVESRHQFGRALGSFQAVQHALADVRLWQECARLATAAAWEDDQSAEAARMAKLLAGRFVRIAAANCQQVLGGMGFTWEHDFHRYLRRGLLLEPVLGTAEHLRGAVGARIRTDGLPRLAAL